MHPYESSVSHFSHGSRPNLHNHCRSGLKKSNNDKTDIMSLKKTIEIKMSCSFFWRSKYILFYLPNGPSVKSGRHWEPPGDIRV